MAVIDRMKPESFFLSSSFGSTDLPDKHVIPLTGKQQEEMAPRQDDEKYPSNAFFFFATGDYKKG